MKYTAKLPEENVNVTPTSPLKEFFVLAGGLLAVVVGTFFLLGLAVDLIVPRISPEVEAKMASLFVNRFELKQGGDPTEAYLQSLVDDLNGRCGKLSYPLKVYLSPSEEVNAVALPGGNIVVFKGLVDKVRSENEMAFVLAHEMGHFAGRDHLRGIGRGLVLLVAAVMIGDADSSVGGMLAGGLGLTQAKFSRTRESQADLYALSALNCLYGHVGGASGFFELIAAPEDEGGKLSHYFASHPETVHRIAELSREAEERGFVKKAVRPMPVFSEVADGGTERAPSP